jgi:uncharacterized protein
MKKTRIAILAVMLVALYATGVQASSADTAACANAKNPRTISVSGHAEISVAPDTAIITTGIVTTGKNVQTARQANNEVMNRLIDALKAQGIDKSKIATTEFTLQPVYRDDPKDNDPPKLVGYSLQNNVTIMVEDLTKIGPVIDQAFAAGANQFNSLQFVLRNQAPLQDELLKKAVEDGKHKATIIATTLGIKLGLPISVSLSNQYVPYANRMMFGKADAASTPIEAGSLTVSTDVSMVFAY